MRLFLMLLTAGQLFADSFQKPQVIATVEAREVDESSGCAVSRQYPGVIWTINDGDRRLVGLNREGKLLGVTTIPGAQLYDWEDIAIGRRNKLYVGDIGDNLRRRTGIRIYRFDEPKPGASKTKPAEAIDFKYPDGPHDAEALIVHPTTDDVYIVTKARPGDGRTKVFRAKAPLKAKRQYILERVAELDLPGLSPISLLVGQITGGTVSPDGLRVAICDYFTAWEAQIEKGAPFDSIWKAKWEQFDIGNRKQGESVCYRADGQAVIATSEGSPMPLIEVKRK